MRLIDRYLLTQPSESRPFCERLKKLSVDEENLVIEQLKVQIAYRKSQVNGCTGNVQLEKKLRDGMLIALLNRDHPSALPISKRVQEVIGLITELRGLVKWPETALPPVEPLEVKGDLQAERDQIEGKLQEIHVLYNALFWDEKTDLYTHITQSWKKPMHFTSFSDEGCKMYQNYIWTLDALLHLPCDRVEKIQKYAHDEGISYDRNLLKNEENKQILSILDQGRQKLLRQLEIEVAKHNAHIHQIVSIMNQFERDHAYTTEKTRNPELGVRREADAQSYAILSEFSCGKEFSYFPELHKSCFQRLQALLTPEYRRHLPAAFEEMQNALYHGAVPIDLPRQLEEARKKFLPEWRSIEQREAVGMYVEYFKSYFGSKVELLAPLESEEVLVPPPPPICEVPTRRIPDGVMLPSHVNALATITQLGLSVDQIAVREEMRTLRPYLYESMYWLLKSYGYIQNDRMGIGEEAFFRDSVEGIDAVPDAIAFCRRQVLDEAIKGLIFKIEE
ncbi:MAG: hypothetical protein JSS61_06080 [Verrucomicrobia bacterium]|nr:hypothetical protein [Verrucomicrobiota bacterium]